MPEPSITKAAFSARHGIAKSRVTELIGEGLPVTTSGRIDPEAGDTWIASRLDPARRAAAKWKGAAASQTKTVAASRAKKLDRENALFDLELAKRRGELIDRAETLRALADFATLHRDA